MNESVGTSYMCEDSETTTATASSPLFQLTERARCSEGLFSLRGRTSVCCGFVAFQLTLS